MGFIVIPKYISPALGLFQYKGVLWIQNHWLPEGCLEYYTENGGDIDWAPDYVQIRSLATPSSGAYVRKDIAPITTTWKKRRYLKIVLEEVTLSDHWVQLVSGAIAGPWWGPGNTDAHVGFKIVNRTLYATVGTGLPDKQESVLDLGGVPAYQRFTLECVYDPSIPECRFYVNEQEKGRLTTNLPEDEPMSSNLFYASIFTIGGSPGYVRINEIRVLQEE